MGDFFAIAFGNLELTVPMEQVYIALVVSIVLITFGYFKIAFTTQFLFIFYWLFIDFVAFSQRNSRGKYNNVGSHDVAIIATLIIFIVIVVTVIKRLGLFSSTK